MALVAWSLVMMIWLYVVRFPAMRRKGISLKGRVGSKTGALDGVVEDQVQWKAHNYNHLMEQPTLFYAICLTLALLGFGGGINLWLAWAYVAFRIAHSLVQATVNVVRWRFLPVPRRVLLPARPHRPRRGVHPPSHDVTGVK